MKRVKINLALIAMFFAVTAAFAFKPVTRTAGKFATTYYAVQTSPNHWVWQTTPPSAPLTCTSGKATCAISTNIAGMPPADGFPSSYTVLSGPDKASVYR